MDTPLSMWITFGAIVVTLLVIDLGVLHRKEREISVRESLWMTFFYVMIALSFGLYVWEMLGPERGGEYYTGYLVEKTLSLDNLFVMSLVFGYFGIPPRYQHRVLFWGIMGVIILRGVMIGAGTAIVARFHWVLFIFAAFLIFTGIRMLFAQEKEQDIGKNPLLKLLRRKFLITDELHGRQFFVRQPHPRHKDKQALWMTPLFVTLLVIEFADVIFAVDSVPAIFAITLDPFIIYTSNIFAILGLRALYFSLAVIMERFAYLKYSLALVLVFIGGKVFVPLFTALEKFPAWISLSVTIGLIAGGVIFSLIKTKREKT